MKLFLSTLTVLSLSLTLFATSAFAAGAKTISPVCKATLDGGGEIGQMDITVQIEADGNEKAITMKSAESPDAGFIYYAPLVATSKTSGSLVYEGSIDFQELGTQKITFTLPKSRPAQGVFVLHKSFMQETDESLPLDCE